MKSSYKLYLLILLLVIGGILVFSFGTIRNISSERISEIPERSGSWYKYPIQISDIVHLRSFQEPYVLLENITGEVYGCIVIGNVAIEECIKEEDIVPSNRQRLDWCDSYVPAELHTAPPPPGSKREQLDIGVCGVDTLYAERLVLLDDGSIWGWMKPTSAHE